MQTTVIEPRLLTEAQAARYINVSPGTLSVWRCTGRYPLPFVRIGRCVRYERAALDRYIDDHIVISND